MNKVLFCVLMVIMVVAGFGQKVVKLEGINQPKTLQIVDDQLFIAEMIKVNIYSMKDFSLQTSFGEAGEGPGKFKILVNAQNGIGVQLAVLPDNILATSIGRLSYFSRDGKFIKEVNTHIRRGPYGENFKVIGDNFIAYGFSVENNVRTMTVNMLDKNFKKIKELYAHPFFVQGGKKFNVEVWRPSLYYVSKNRIVIDREDESLIILDKNGKELNQIKYDFPLVKVTNERKKNYTEFLKKDPRFRDQFDMFMQMAYFPEYLPRISYFSVDDKNIYVLTNLKKDGKSLFCIFDFQGKFVRKAWVPISERTPIEPYAFTIHNGVLYQLNENLDNEEWELYITKI